MTAAVRTPMSWGSAWGSCLSEKYIMLKSWLGKGCWISCVKLYRVIVGIAENHSVQKNSHSNSFKTFTKYWARWSFKHTSRAIEAAGDEHGGQHPPQPPNGLHSSAIHRPHSQFFEHLGQTTYWFYSADTSASNHSLYGGVRRVFHNLFYCLSFSSLIIQPMKSYTLLYQLNLYDL